MTPYSSDKVAREVHAESVAYIVCRHLGIDTSGYSFEYIAGWSGDKELKVLKEQINSIQQTADRLIYRLEPVMERQMELKKERCLLQPELPVPDIAPETDPEILAEKMAQINFVNEGSYPVAGEE